MRLPLHNLVAQLHADLRRLLSGTDGKEIWVNQRKSARDIFVKNQTKHLLVIKKITNFVSQNNNTRACANAISLTIKT